MVLMSCLWADWTVPELHTLYMCTGYVSVNKYELLCVERATRGQSGPDEEKMLLAFQALDTLMPNLGVYTRIFKRLRDDLYGKFDQGLATIPLICLS